MVKLNRTKKIIVAAIAGAAILTLVIALPLSLNKEVNATTNGIEEDRIENGTSAPTTETGIDANEPPEQESNVVGSITEEKNPLPTTTNSDDDGTIQPEDGKHEASSGAIKLDYESGGEDTSHDSPMNENDDVSPIDVNHTNGDDDDDNDVYYSMSMEYDPAAADEMNGGDTDDDDDDDNNNNNNNNDDEDDDDDDSSVVFCYGPQLPRPTPSCPCFDDQELKYAWRDMPRNMRRGFTFQKDVSIAGTTGNVIGIKYLYSEVDYYDDDYYDDDDDDDGNNTSTSTSTFNTEYLVGEGYCTVTDFVDGDVALMSEEHNNITMEEETYCRDLIVARITDLLNDDEMNIYF